MNRIEQAFKKEKLFISFLTAGDPTIKDSVSFIKTLIKNGSNLVEIGLPFSDPVAEGKVIEQANYRALKNNTTTDDVFNIIKEVRIDDDITPLAILSYMNPIYVYGIDKFLSRAQEVKLDALIIPDLPFEESTYLKKQAKLYNIDLITLIAPTSKERIKDLALQASGFIYLVSSLGVTGVRTNIESNLSSIVNEIKEVTNIPVAVGFGISTSMQVEQISQISDGVIIGSAIVKIIAEHGNQANDYLAKYTQEIKESIK